MTTKTEPTSDLARAECVKLRAELARAAESVVEPHRLQLLIVTARQYAGTETGSADDRPAEAAESTVSDPPAPEVCPACEAYGDGDPGIEATKSDPIVQGVTTAEGNTTPVVADAKPQPQAARPMFRPEHFIGCRCGVPNGTCGDGARGEIVDASRMGVMVRVDDDVPADEVGRIVGAPWLRIHFDGNDIFSHFGGTPAPGTSDGPTPDDNAATEPEAEDTQPEPSKAETPDEAPLPPTDGEDLNRVAEILGGIELPAAEGTDPVYGRLKDCARTVIEDAVFQWKQTADLDSLARACRILHDGQPVKASDSEAA